MLRIKADKWEEFCEYAEGIGFEETNSNHDDVLYALFGEDCNVVFKDKTIVIRDNDLLYEFITKGYVEKV